MSKWAKSVSLLCLMIVISIVLNACNRSINEGLAGYDYKGINIGDGKKSITDVLGEPDDIDEDDGGVYSQIGYADAEFILKKDKVIAMSIHKDFALPNGVAVDDPLSKAVETFGAENLLQEPDNPKTVNHLLDKSYAIALSFREQDEELFNDSSIDSITIADAEATLEARGGNFTEFKKKLVPVTFKEREIADAELTESNSIESIKYSQDFYGTWIPVNAEEGGGVYIELDDMGRGVLEFRNEGETLSYMIHPVEESEQETVVEYDDETGVTHTMSMSIQNELLYLKMDGQPTTTYKRSK